jgi:hypothetical protein
MDGSMKPIERDDTKIICNVKRKRGTRINLVIESSRLLIVVVVVDGEFRLFLAFKNVSSSGKMNKAIKKMINKSPPFCFC